MKTFFLYILLIIITGNHCAAQGIFAADIFINRSSYGVYPYINTFTQGEALPFVLLDYGDGQEDVLIGQNFGLGNGLYYNIYHPSSPHIYGDTGEYTIQLVDVFWATGFTNIEDSESQPFLLSADVVVRNEPNLIYNTSIIFSTGADYIEYESNGSINHPPVPVDMQEDSISQRFVDIDAAGYYFPEATDSLVCCFTWDRPTEPGKYAFGFDFEDYRWGKKMSRVQRYITVEVDSVISNNSGLIDQERGFIFFPNPADNFLRIMFKGSYILGTQYSLSIKNALGIGLFHKPISLMEYSSGVEINISTWPSGLYLVTLESGGQVWTEKLIVQ